MIYTELTKKAMKYLFLVQGAQKDLSGIPYVFHPWHLAE
ncbi:MAG TPA: GTP pyrophosphokinase, partial [Lachnoclostridium sp.]|nr:GTP pyrophosphokinase [Lachnoclostridium sp.]